MEEMQENKEICPHCGWEFPKSDEISSKNQSKLPKTTENTDYQLEDAQDNEASSSFYKKHPQKGQKRSI